VLEYAYNRTLFMDEASVLVNLDGRPIFDVWTKLTYDQLAPPGFLVVERLMIRLPLNRPWDARLFPLLCGIGSVFLFRAVAQRFVARRAVPIAVGLFALADYVIYYAAEVKQYSSDVTFALAGLYLSARFDELTPRRLAILTVFGVVGVWMSHPIAFVLGGVGSYYIVRAVLRRRWWEGCVAAAMSLFWLVSFAGSHAVSNHLLDSERFMWDWWGFAFLPLPPTTLDEASRVFWQLVNVFVNPACILNPFGLHASAFVASALFGLGMGSLGLRWRGGLFLLVSPVLLALAASALRQYPFHGRLLLFLAPTLHLLVAEGAAALTRPLGSRATLCLGLFLLARPAYDAVWFKAIEPRFRPFDSHADLASDLLDERERSVLKRAVQESVQKSRRSSRAPGAPRE
jgi:hypothetical protein